MSANQSDLFASLDDALRVIHSAAGLYLNESYTFRRQEIRPSIINLIPLILGFIGLVFNILALVIFTASKTFRQGSFRCYIYVFVLVNCASILTHSWLYLLFYVVDPVCLCKYIQYLQQSLSTTSHWIMIFLSFERSFTFLRPFTIKKLFKTRTIYFILFITACFCFTMHLDQIFFVDVIAHRWVNFAYGTCSRKYHSRLLTDRMKILTHTLSFLIPFLLNSILDIYICFNICQRRKRLLTKSAINKIRRSKISLANEITLTLLCQSMWLLITYFPRDAYYSLLSFQIIKDYDRDNSTLVFLIRQNLLIYLAFSPTLFVILSPTLRREIRSHLCRTYKQRKALSSSYLSNTNSRIEQFFQTVSFRQPRTYSSILIAHSEELPRKFRSQSTAKTQQLFQQKSQSTSCIITEINPYEFERCKIPQRALTLNE